MPLELIPNQPFIFEQALPDQPCLNNDPNAYTQMTAPDDIICVQQVITPCTEGVMCDPDMYELGSELLTGAWTASDGWSSADLNHVSYDGASYNAFEVCFLPLGTMISGIAYRLTFEITSITGNMYVNVGSGGNTFGDVYDALGTYEVYVVSNQSSSYIEFITGVMTTGDTVEITINSFEQIVDDCWVVEVDTLIPTFNYSYNEVTGQGQYCGIGAETVGALTNSSAFTTVLNYHRVSFTITSMTTGHLEVILGGVYLGSIYENGEYNLYGVPTTGTDLIFQSWDSFDGCISYVSVDDFGLLDNTDLANAVYKLEVINASNLAVGTDPISFEIWDDRIIWCFNVSDLTNGTLPIELACTIDYKLKITAQCSDEVEPVEYISTTILRYNTDGWDCTFIMSAYSDGYAFGFYFGSVTAPLFYLTQRLRVLQFAPKYPAIGEEYLYSNGSFSRSFAQSGKVRQAWFDYVDEACHDVIRLQILSDVLTLDSDVYFAPLKDYEPEWDEHRYNLAQSRIDLVKEETLFNRSCFSVGQAPCTTNVVTIPPSTAIGYELIGELDLTNVTASNFIIVELFTGSYATQSGNNATTAGGRTAIASYFQSFFTGAVVGLNGTVINTSVTYVAPMLQITITGTGNYNSTYSAFAFTVDVPTIPSNVIMLQPA